MTTNTILYYGRMISYSLEATRHNLLSTRLIIGYLITYLLILNAGIMGMMIWRGYDGPAVYLFTFLTILSAFVARHYVKMRVDKQLQQLQDTLNELANLVKHLEGDEED